VKCTLPDRNPKVEGPITRREFLRSAMLFGTAGLLAACVSPGEDFARLETDTIRRLVILYTNDEHGWMESWEQASGADGMFHLWQTREGYDPSGPYLILSGGDMWTGPALSTWFEGESMIDMMNAMGYQAAAIGNHDFDYGLDSLRARMAQASFPFLSANIRRKDDGSVPDFATPFINLNINGVNVGIIGLTTIETSIDTLPEHVAELDFLPYERALRETVPQVRSKGADLILVLAHICTSEMERLAPIAAELDIPLIFGGHCHEETNAVVSGVTLVQSGSFLINYIRIALLYDTAARRVVDIHSSLQPNRTKRTDQDLQTRIAAWRQRSDPDIWKPIGYARGKIDSQSPTMAAMLTSAWLSAYPQGQVAIASPRYVQSIPAGEITPATVISTLPTENQLVDVLLTGKQILEIIAARQPILGGITEGDGYIFDDGSLLQAEASYHVLLPDALYQGGNYYVIKDDPPGARYTGINWKAPVIEWIASLHTSSSNPLEDHLGE
jgi:5'-nucleotidase / UDP-sugar diphosphatase